MFAPDPGAIRRLRRAAAAPAPFAEDAWTLADGGDGATLEIDVRAAPADGGAPLLRFEAQLGGGAAAPLADGAALGPRRLPAPAGTPTAVSLRAVNAVGAAPWSAPKSATVIDRSTILAFVPTTLDYGVAA